jgi:protein involved in polysaccharide export with SLBB domain
LPPTERILVAALLLLFGVLSGCAAFTNPVANGVPVSILPPELLAESREGYETIPLTLLRQAPPENYILATGDTLGIYIEGVLGSAETPPPVQVPATPELPPSIGYPFPIRQDGTISLPYVEPVKVAGMTLEEAEKAVIKAYVDKQILRPEDRRILVSLQRPRQVRVLVVRDDSQGAGLSVTTQSLYGLGSTSAQIGGGSQATGQVVELPAYENDVLNALTRTGGLPSEASTQEVIIQRGYWNGGNGADMLAGDQFCHPTQADLEADEDGKRRIVRIPIETRGGEPLPFTREDVILENGDILIVRSREPELYYTGGLLPASEIALPYNYDLTVVEAVLRSNGPLLNGGINASNLNGQITGAGVGNPSPSLLSVLRKAPNGQQVTIRVNLNEAVRDPRENILVQAGDVLILQETPQEALARYISQTVQFNFFFRILDRSDAQGSATIVAP